MGEPLTPYRAPKDKEVIQSPMVSNYVQTPVNKFNSEFVDRATQIVNLFSAHIDANCPHCLELLNKSGLRTRPQNQTIGADNPKDQLGHDYREY